MSWTIFRHSIIYAENAERSRLVKRHGHLLVVSDNHMLFDLDRVELYVIPAAFKERVEVRLIIGNHLRKLLIRRRVHNK